MVLWYAPIGQTIFHVVPDVALGTARAWTAGLGWLAGVAVAVAVGRRVPLAGWALATGALFLLPSSSVAPLKESMAEHRAYGLGLALALATAWTFSAPRVSGAGRVVLPWAPCWTRTAAAAAAGPPGSATRKFSAFFDAWPGRVSWCSPSTTRTRIPTDAASPIT